MNICYPVFLRIPIFRPKYFKAENSQQQKTNESIAAARLKWSAKHGDHSESNFQKISKISKITIFHVFFPTEVLHYLYLVPIISAGSKAKLYFKVWETGNRFAFRIVMYEFRDFAPVWGPRSGFSRGSNLADFPHTRYYSSRTLCRR